MVLELKTLPPASRHRAAGMRATEPSYAQRAGRFRPNTVRQILNRFQLFFIPEIVSNFQNS
jgi:hypothetical protein